MWFVFWFLCDSKLNVFGMWTKQDIWGHYLGLWETLINIFHNFLAEEMVDRWSVIKMVKVNLYRLLTCRNQKLIYIWEADIRCLLFFEILKGNRKRAGNHRRMFLFSIPIRVIFTDETRFLAPVHLWTINHGVSNPKIFIWLSFITTNVSKHVTSEQLNPASDWKD